MCQYVVIPCHDSFGPCQDEVTPITKIQYTTTKYKTRLNFASRPSLPTQVYFLEDKEEEEIEPKRGLKVNNSTLIKDQAMVLSGQSYTLSSIPRKPIQQSRNNFQAMRLKPKSFTMIKSQDTHLSGQCNTLSRELCIMSRYWQTKIYHDSVTLCQESLAPCQDIVKPHIYITHTHN